MTEALHVPKLLKSRQLHSRVFAVALILLLLVCEPMMSLRSDWRAGMYWLGYALVILGTFGRIYSSVYIGGRKNDVIVREGPFGMVRNPLYVFSFIAAAGIGLQSGMIIFFLLLVVSFVMYYPLVVSREEDFLGHKFGESYEVYKKEVPRWLPNLSLWNEPEQVDAKPKFVRNALKDAAVFFLPLPAYALINYMHIQQILPVWLTLP